MDTFYWHDYETWGIDPRRDRAAQFAGIRTDLDLKVIDEPLVLYCKPARDMLPDPYACLVTGITPQKALQEGVPEAEFFRRIHLQLIRPGTCTVGYNNIRFDDEFTRYGFYRNFIDPYAREWQNGNSRWDLLDMLRLTCALRPQGIEWPKHPDGKPSFRLEELTRANGIEHSGAHDALADVYATIAVAGLVKQHQPRLFDYVYRRRGKHPLASLLSVTEQKPILHASAMYPSEYCGLAMVVPVARHPTNKNGVVVFDLRHDPQPLLALDVKEIHRRLFTPVAELADTEARIPIKTVHLNKCPVLAPLNTLTSAAAKRLCIDVDQGLRYLETIRRAQSLEHKIQQVLSQQVFEPIDDPDQSLYTGGFFSTGDRQCITEVRRSKPEELAQLKLECDDPRLPELLFRYRARNWPDTLKASEQADWEAFRGRRLTSADGGGVRTMDAYRLELERLRNSSEVPEEKRHLLDKLEAYANSL